MYLSRLWSLLLSHREPARVPLPPSSHVYIPSTSLVPSGGSATDPVQFMHGLELAPASVLQLEAAGCRLGSAVPCEELEAGPESQAARKVRHSPVAGGWIWSAAPSHTCSVSQVPTRGQQLLIYGGENENSLLQHLKGSTFHGELSGKMQKQQEAQSSAQALVGRNAAAAKMKLEENAKPHAPVPTRPQLTCSVACGPSVPWIYER